jgi:hypothetical protein
MGTNIFLNTTCQTTRTRLDKVYNQHINCLFETLDEEDEIRWETYGLVIDQLLNQGHKNVLKEIKYRLTDDENPNSVMLDLITRYSDCMDGLIWLLKRRIEEYLEDDFFKRFY